MADGPERTVFSGTLSLLQEMPSLMVRRDLSRHWWFILGRVPLLPVSTSCVALFCIVFLAVGFGCLVLMFIGSSDSCPVCWFVVRCGVWAVFDLFSASSPF